nr:hypothetical protein [Tanacetum cinerariifolium]
ETAFPTGDARYGEAFLTVTSLDVGQDRENITKTSAMPHEASPRITSLGSAKVKERRICSEGCSKHEGVDQGEDLSVGDTVKDSNKSADKGSDSTDDMANVLGTLGAANILTSGGLRSVFTTASLSIDTASAVVSPVIATASKSFPTAVIFTTASVATSTTRVTRSSRGVAIESSSPIYVNIPSISKKDKGKGKMTEPEQPSKEKVLEQISAQLARDLEAKFAQEDQIIREQAERDSEIARIHVERELKMMIAELDRNNEIVAKGYVSFGHGRGKITGKGSIKIGTSSTNILGTKEYVHQAVKEKESLLRFIALPNWFHEAQMATSNEVAKKDDAIPDNSAPQKDTKVSTNDSFELASSSTVETEVPTVSTPVPTGSLYVPSVTSSVPIIILKGGSSYPKPLSLGNAKSFENMLEDFFGDTSDAVSLNDVEANLSNMETAIQVSPTPTLRIHKDHPKSQIICPIDTHVQTRQKTKNVD